MGRRGRLARTAAIAAAVLGVPFLVAWYEQVRRWGAVHTGSLNSPGTPPNYDFFSGFGSIILPPLLNGLAVGAVFWWHHQCGVTGCYWYARRKTAAGEPACWRHHPEHRRTAADLHAAHHEARGGPR
jgi:hypothetical protein